MATVAWITSNEPQKTFYLQKSQVTIQFIRKLLEAGAEIDTLDRKDRTPIMIAAEFHPDPGYEFEIFYNVSRYLGFSAGRIAKIT